MPLDGEVCRNAFNPKHSGMRPRPIKQVCHNPAETAKAPSTGLTVAETVTLALLDAEMVPLTVTVAVWGDDGVKDGVRDGLEVDTDKDAVPVTDEVRVDDGLTLVGAVLPTVPNTRCCVYTMKSGPCATILLPSAEQPTAFQPALVIADHVAP
jgi:hypothetical protein